jgi:hypothetical protein
MLLLIAIAMNWMRKTEAGGKVRMEFLFNVERKERDKMVSNIV